MAESDAKQAWITRVLGYNFAAPQAGGGDMLKIWVDAKDRIDAAIGELQKALRDNGDPDLQQIAEYGLHGLTKGENVRMMAALRETQAGSPKGTAKLAGAVEEYREFLEGRLADLLEGNPFGVAVPIRTVLGGALDALSRNLPR